jgi:hypothetical protein
MEIAVSEDSEGPTFSPEKKLMTKNTRWLRKVSSVSAKYGHEPMSQKKHQLDSTTKRNIFKSSLLFMYGIQSCASFVFDHHIFIYFLSILASNCPTA